jgi:pimeloyl-ACP methyl ester carboxylesterase
MSLKRRLVIPAASILVLAVIYFGLSAVIMNQALVAEVWEIEERPQDLNLVFEEVEFAPRGWPDLTLRGWWLPAENAKATVVRVHGIDSNRGYRLGLVKALVEGGYSVLTFDLRGHGESDVAQMGAGIHERDDVLGAIDYVIQERDAAAGEIFLHGLSYGAAIVLMAGVDEPAVSGVFADSSFAGLLDMIVQEVAERTPIPNWGASLLQPGLVWAARILKGLDINEVRPVDAAAEYEYQLGLIHCRDDDRIPIRHLTQIRRAVQIPPLFTTFDGCEHGQAWNDFPEQYEAIVLDYYDERASTFE